MKKILLLTITTITVTTLIECYTGVPRMPQFGLRIPRAPRFRPPSFTPSSNVQSPQSQLMSQASSHPFASQIRPSSLHMGSMIGHSPQPGFPSPMSHHQISSPSSSHSMPFPMRPGPPMMDIPHSMIRPPHHPIAPIFASMHHHTQASHPPPSYHPKPSFYHGKTDDCPFPGCEMEPTYNGEAPVPSPYQVESPMIPSLTSPDSSPLDLSPRPPLDHEQYGSRQPMLSMGKQPVKVVYKPVVKLVKVPVEVPVKVRQPYPVKVPVPVQIPFPVKVIQREKIMFPIAVPFGQVLPVTALGSPAQIRSSVNYGNENTPTQGGFVAPLKNYRTYHDEGDNDNSISIDRGMVGWSPIRIPPQSSSHQMAESRMSNDGIDDDGEKEAVDSFMQDRVDNDFAFGASSHIDSIHRPVSIETPYVTGKLIKSPMIISKMHKRS
nr:extensin-like [Dermatophagoides farinae]